MFWNRRNNNRQIGTAMIWQSICFALCFFSFMMAEAMTNSRAAELLGAEYVNTVYAIGLLCTGIGFLSFSALRRLFKSERLRKAVICIVGIACIVSCCVSSQQIILDYSPYLQGLLWCPAAISEAACTIITQ